MANPTNVPERIFTVAGRGYILEFLPRMELSFGADGFVNRANGEAMTDAQVLDLLIHRDSIETLQPGSVRFEPARAYEVELLLNPRGTES